MENIVACIPEATPWFATPEAVAAFTMLGSVASLFAVIISLIVILR